MSRPDAHRVALGPGTDDRLAAIFAPGALGFAVGAITAATTRSYAAGMAVWLVLWAMGAVVLVRRCATVIDTDGIHRRGLRRSRSVAWSDIDAAWWGEYPARTGDADAADIRLYTWSRRSGDYLSIADIGPGGIVEPRTRLARRRRQRLLDSVHALQAHGVPVDATTLQLRSTMWALGLEPSGQENSDLPHQSPGPFRPGGQA